MSGLRLELGAHTAAVESRLAALRAAGAPARLAAADATLWGGDDARRAAIANRLGWLGSPASMLARCDEFTAFAREVRAEGFTRVVLLGMGGSSLAPEVLARALGVQSDGLPLVVLDDTSPAAVRAALEGGDVSTTLTLVASKSGGTLEVTSFDQAFAARASAALGADAGETFVAITDPGTALETMARARGFRQVFTNPADIGGRFSVLSCFGLVPAALLGLDPATLCRSGAAEVAALAGDGGDAFALGAAIGELARQGRDKLTLVMDRSFEPIGVWIEQLVAESTGKQGVGVLPVDGERLAAPAAYGDDRVFVSVSLGEPDATTRAALDALAAAGHPVLRWRRESPGEIGAEFARWEIATAVAGLVLGVNPFDEPNVSEAKAATRTVLARAIAEGGLPVSAPRARDGELELHGALGSGAAARDWATALLDALRPGDYAALLAWLHRTAPRHEALERIRHAVRAGTRAAATLGYGPRYLHSTGQLHKGGPETGVFLVITADEGDLPVPGEPHGFAVLRGAQAAGDVEVLAAHGLRVMRVHLGADTESGLSRLAEAFEAAAAARA